ncbi:MAG: hypothetical protein RJA36_3312 [Pseudomonadota bacterium]|jgi:thiamine biosynthesis lipoprotein
MRCARPLLGTYVDISVSHPDAALCAQAVAGAFAAIERVQALMSAFLPGSDIERIGRLAHLQPVGVAPWTLEVLHAAQELHARSGGLFDPGVAAVLARWDMLPSTEGDCSASSIANLHIEGDRVSCSVPTRLDLGGIAKGYAVDRAADALLAAGVDSGLVNAGGDLRVVGAAQEPIFVRDPGDPGRLHFAGLLEEGAFATSATYYSRHAHGGREVSAIVNPASGEPLLARHSYSVIAPLCLHADALTKVLALSDNPELPCFAYYGAQPLILPSP